MDNHDKPNRKKLSLNKQTLRVLADDELTEVNGGLALELPHLTWSAKCRKSADMSGTGPTCFC
ncbi:class I lanthipeptide [Archangium violaceum]|nr:class I lanthipeptide [Archangium violaceum]